ncbi:hypothetical protein NG800_007490 [Epilithonimonas ginsengisoli]|uniref:Uncharacterized protein n=1 Tax=Epilithonimonas ginsengisoli TaxID=1245592 RepID=A0ABU4JGE4_9FLAO|nr:MULTISPECIES: hypothetical protein [Chryseobacterium group]MBV6880099.1 hypothetical protein [Epilithonimonas sp. FP105]MDW8548749.1 hypothetical protein [Epilithonimonas ginsengisoli]OAH75002.1 hypothetical protein AXA65_04790 [Chryseobacterium sp. FP211-J200]
MRKFLLLFILIYNFCLSQQRDQPLEIKSNADFIHKTGVIFPKEWNGLKRDRLVSYDKNNDNVGATYYFKANKKVTNISIYIYPAEVSNENLRDQFLSFKTVVNRNATNQPDISPEFVKLKSEKVVINGLKSYFDYNIIVPDFMKGQKEQKNKSFFSVYDCGKWNVKFRISVEDGDFDRVKQLEKALIAYFEPVKIAEKYQIESGKNAEILISKTAQRDSLMLKSTIEESEAKKEWLNTNKSAAELSAGFSDFEIESHVSAIQHKLKFYNEKKDKIAGSEETKKYFENLQKIYDNGYLKDFIYSQTFGVVIYPDGENRKNLYSDFVKQNNIPQDIIELMYRIYY